MIKVRVVNLRCEGCAGTIKKALEREGLRDVSVDTSSSEVRFEGDRSHAAAVLERLGYPEEGSAAAGALLKKESCYSCTPQEPKQPL